MIRKYILDINYSPDIIGEWKSARPNMILKIQNIQFPDFQTSNRSLERKQSQYQYKDWLNFANSVKK